jgi:hypothetical protein
VTGANGPPRRFRVDAAAATVQKVERLYQEAGQTGRAADFVAAMQRLRSTLQTRPRECGEPLRVYQKARFELRVAAVRPAIMWFVVHEVEYEVVLLEVELMSAS